MYVIKEFLILKLLKIEDKETEMIKKWNIFENKIL